MNGMGYMRPWLTGGGVYLLSGAGAVSVWRATGASLGGGDLLVWLVGLPTALLGAAWMVQRWRATRVAPAPSDAATDSASNAEAADLPAGAARTTALAVVASALWLPAGRDAPGVVDTLRRQQRPGLHSTLRDLHGFPVTAAEVEDVDEADAEWGLDPAEDANDGLRRAVALLRPVAEDLLLEALPDAPAHGYEQELDADGGRTMHPYAMHHSQSARAPAAAQQATLRIALLAPTHWSESIRGAISNALGELAISLGHDPTTLNTQVHPVHREADVWQLLSSLEATLADSPVTGDRALILAADSWLDEPRVEEFDAADRLLRSGTPEGEVPGEGAAGLLLAAGPGNATGASNPAANVVADAGANADAGIVYLHLPQQARLADTVRPRDAARTTGELIARALETAGCDADAPLQVVTSADHRPSRMVEAATALVMQRPELDPVEDALHLGVACGSMGVAGPLALLAVAAAHARDSETPTLALALSDATSRAAAVLAPAPPAPLSPAAAASAT